MNVFSFPLSRPMGIVVLLTLAITFTGCQLPSKPKKTEGGYYGGDRPPDSVDVDIAAIPDAVPIPLPRSRTGNKPYKALGRTWNPLDSAEGYRERGIASWYGKKFHGRRTSSGEPYDMFAMTAAHTVLPLPTFVRVTSLDNGRSVVVKVNDRGPFLHGRIIDLSYAAAWKLDITRTGTGRVEVEALDPSATISSEAETTSVENRVWTGVAGNVPPVSSADMPTAEGRYVVQIGSFNDLENAFRLRNLLRNAGYELSPKRDDDLKATAPPFQVIVGPYVDWADADRARMDLERITGHSGLLRER